MTLTEKVKTIAKILKHRFPSVTELEAIHIAYLIVEAILEPRE